MDEWREAAEHGLKWGHFLISWLQSAAPSGLDEMCLLWCVSPLFPLTSLWIFPFGSVRFQNGSIRWRSAHPLWRQRRRRRERRTGHRERGSQGWRRRSGWPEGLQAVDGTKSTDNGHLQPEPRQTELPHRQPLPLHLPRRQSHQEVRKTNNRVAISFPQQSRCIWSLHSANPCLANAQKCLQIRTPTAVECNLGFSVGPRSHLQLQCWHLSLRLLLCNMTQRCFHSALTLIPLWSLPSSACAIIDIEVVFWSCCF